MFKSRHVNIINNLKLNVKIIYKGKKRKNFKQRLINLRIIKHMGNSKNS